MSFSNTFETAQLLHIFNNVAIAGLGDAGGLLPSASAGSLYIAMHTADPGEAGDQTTSESAYTSYARVAVARSAGGWTISGASVTNAAQVQFPTCTGSTSTLTHFSIGYNASGSSTIILSVQLTSSLVVSNNIIPLFPAASMTATLD